MSKPESSMKMYDDSPLADIKKFFFLFENVFMRGKSDDEKATVLLSNFDGRAFDFFYEKFPEEDGIKAAASDY